MTGRLSLPALILLAAASPAAADLIVPASVAGSGSYFNDAGLLIDGVLPPRQTFYSAPTNVYWNGTTPAFVIDLGGLRTVESLTIGVDNNDDYLVESSTDGVTFSSLFLFLASDGPVSPNPGGFDILTTDAAYPASPGDDTTPAYVGRSFSPVEARYLRVSATGGDDYYAVSEVQAFGPAPVPEPASLALLGLGGLATLAKARRRSARDRA